MQFPRAANSPEVKRIVTANVDLFPIQLYPASHTALVAILTAIDNVLSLDFHYCTTLEYTLPKAQGGN